MTYCGNQGANIDWLTHRFPTLLLRTSELWMDTINLVDGSLLGSRKSPVIMGSDGLLFPSIMNQMVRLAAFFILTEWSHDAMSVVLAISLHDLTCPYPLPTAHSDWDYSLCSVVIFCDTMMTCYQDQLVLSVGFSLLPRYARFFWLLRSLVSPRFARLQ
jgi:hypothetical protein